MPRNLRLLSRVGEATFGEFWQSPMAEYLNLSRRTINRWKQGHNPVPDALEDGTDLMSRLYRLLQMHERDVTRLREQMEKHL